MRTVALTALLAVSLSAQDIGPKSISSPACCPVPSVAAAVAELAQDAGVRAQFAPYGLDIMSLTWEDTGRSKNSAWGPNISDLTIQLLDQPGPRPHHAWCMPVVRFPNFADKSCDVPLDSFKVLVGNERGAPLQPIDLRSYLQNFARYQTAPTGWLKGDLVGARDRVALTSAQACFLPVPQGGAATFAPVLFNYQSRPGAPAVLTIMATPEGTSAQVITNSGEAASGVWHGQRLFHNQNGQRAPLRATRFSDHQQQAAQQGVALPGDAASRDGLSLVLVIQIPLVVPEPPRHWDNEAEGFAAPAAAAAPMEKRQRGGGMETAVVQAGPSEGPWLGLAGQTIERDWRFPIRTTVQFYQATDGAAVTSTDAQRVAQAIQRIYLDAESVGSLVVDGCTGRPTEHQVQVWPAPWWEPVCRDYTARHGEPWDQAIARIRSRLGADWQPADARELSNALALARP